MSNPQNKKYFTDEERRKAGVEAVHRYRLKPGIKERERVRAGELNPKKYGLTRKQYDEKLANQNRECAICHIPLNDSHDSNGKALDHDHVTGRNRDFLCNRHNRGLGFFNDSILELEATISYLKRHNQ